MADDASRCVAVPRPKLGEVLAGKYRLDRVLAARAGWGSSSPRRAPGARSSPSPSSSCRSFSSRTTRAPCASSAKARSAARIRSEHVARVLDVDRLPGGAPYIVMEYLEGEDLQPDPRPRRTDRRGRRRRLRDPGRRGHRRGARGGHRPPGSQAGEPVPLPAAKRIAAHQGARLRDLEADAADRHASPEQSPDRSPRRHGHTALCIAGAATFIRATWTSGRTSGRSVSSSTSSCRGRRLFAADGFSQIISKVGHVACRPLQEVQPDAPPALGAAIALCLAKDPGERFQTVAEPGEGPRTAGAPRRSLLSVERAGEHRRLPTVWGGHSTAPRRRRRPAPSRPSALRR